MHILDLVVLCWLCSHSRQTHCVTSLEHAAAHLGQQNTIQGRQALTSSLCLDPALFFALLPQTGSPPYAGRGVTSYEKRVGQVVLWAGGPLPGDPWTRGCACLSASADTLADALPASRLNWWVCAVR